MNKLKMFALTLLLFSVCVPAHAVLITTSIGKYDVTLFPEDTYTNLKDTLDDQPWWNDPTLATEFASLVGDLLGTNCCGQGHLGPYFATGDNGSRVNAALWVFLDSSAVHNNGQTAVGNTRLYTQASSVPEPVSMALLGIGLAGLGWSRRKRA